MQLPDKSWLDCDHNHISGFINHNNDLLANCTTETLYVKRDNLLHVYIKTLRDIRKNEELTYNYFAHG